MKLYLNHNNKNSEKKESIVVISNLPVFIIHKIERERETVILFKAINMQILESKS